MKTLVLGGYGNFGARICRALSGDPSVQIIVGGRDLGRAESLAAQLGHGARGVAVDLAATNFPETLRALGIQLLIHTAGPFQQQDFNVAAVAAAAGAHYIDLADGRRFVCDFPSQMEGVFCAAGRTAITGASTIPALSSAVVDHICQGWQRIDAIDTCIAPAQTAPRGLATLAAVLSYCGESIQVWEGGRWQSGLGWAQLKSVSFARLRRRLGGLCDTPDLELFPQHYCVSERVIFRAALEVGITQRFFAALAMLRKARLIGQPARLAHVLNFLARPFDFLGTALGGMVVRVEGADASGLPIRRAWHIAADNNHGPEIPCMAAILLARRIARGESLPVGAFACMGMLKLAEFEPEFARWHMVTDTIDELIGHGASTL